MESFVHKTSSLDLSLPRNQDFLTIIWAYLVQHLTANSFPGRRRQARNVLARTKVKRCLQFESTAISSWCSPSSFCPWSRWIWSLRSESRPAAEPRTCFSLWRCWRLLSTHPAPANGFRREYQHSMEKAEVRTLLPEPCSFIVARQLQQTKLWQRHCRVPTAADQQNSMIFPGFQSFFQEFVVFFVGYVCPFCKTNKVKWSNFLLKKTTKLLVKIKSFSKESTN